MNASTIRHEFSIFERLLLPPEAAAAVLSLRFSADDERRMQELMDLNNRGEIGAEERNEMEAFRRICTFLAIIQAKARLQIQTAGDTRQPVLSKARLSG